MGFDFIITNPPYNKTLYLDILEYLIKNDKNCEIVSVNPSQHLTDVLASRGYKVGSSFSKYENSVYRHIKDALYFDTEEFNRRFDIKYTGNGAIYYIIPNKTFKKYKTAFQDMNKHGEIVYSVLSRIIKTVFDGDVVYNHFKPFISGNLVAMGEINSGYISGELLSDIHKRVYSSKDEFLKNYRGLNKEDKIDTPRNFVCFKTLKEAQNFIEFLDSDFIKFYTRGIQIDVHPMFKFIPLLDMSEKWSNERLCEYYNVSEEEFKLCLEWFKS